MIFDNDHREIKICLGYVTEESKPFVKGCSNPE
jgi:hypothetical protein